MMRGPHRYGMGRAADSDAGGVADLQTDVMRFMAILALCLVVIFALVQSIPRPVDVPQADPPAAAAPAEPAAIADPEPVSAPTPEHVPVVQHAPEPVKPVETVQPKPVPEATPVQQQATAAAEPATPAPTEVPPEGFTLQFESDVALTRLVGRNAVSLYALDDDSALRMSVSRGRVSFWPASLPASFHEMDASTVPAEVTAALGRIRTAGAPRTWGVTLPASMQRELDAIVREHDGGALYIAGDGRIRLER